MRRLFILLAINIMGMSAFAQKTFLVTNSGSIFTPAIVNAVVGDQVTFNVGSFHPVLQVSEATYNANGKTALAGGFAFPSGSGTYQTSVAGTYYYVCTNHIASGMKGKIIVSVATGIKQEVSTSGFELFPNPAINQVNIKNMENVEPNSVSLYDISGKTIFNSENISISEDKKIINTSSLKKGIYFITLMYPNKFYTKKFIKL